MTGRKNLLNKRVAELMSEAKSKCEDAHVEISFQPFETEDAHILVHCPESWDLDQCAELSWHMAGLTSDILLDDGLSIPVLVIEPPERVKKENEAFRAALKKQAS